ncbi:MAG: uracil-xanthine permease family protein [Clostridia bacterium]
MNAKTFLPKLTFKNFLLSFQHLFAMFGSTVLVPFLTGLNPSVAIFTAGLGTIAFHIVTKGKVPSFLGSSFMFIPAITLIVNSMGVQYAQGGIICAGFMYLLLSLAVHFVGVERIRSLFPPVVTGPVIVVIGLTLVPTGVSMASANWTLAVIAMTTIVVISVFTKGFFKLVPVLLAIVVGYICALGSDILFHTAFVDFSPITSLFASSGITDLSAWFNNPFDFSGDFLTLPKFDINAILLIAPIAFVTFMEHLGDITTNGAVVGKDFFKDPGLNRTLAGDGVATIIAGCLGGPANTTYSENTGVLAVTKNYDPALIRLTAILAVCLGIIAPFGGFLQTIPGAVMGGVCLVLFGMIASVGIRTLSESDLDFSHSRNLLIVTLILVLGLGLGSSIEFLGISLSGAFISVVVGVILNIVLPKEI